MKVQNKTTLTLANESLMYLLSLKRVDSVSRCWFRVKQLWRRSPVFFENYLVLKNRCSRIQIIEVQVLDNKGLYEVCFNFGHSDFYKAFEIPAFCKISCQKHQYYHSLIRHTGKRYLNLCVQEIDSFSYQDFV